MANIKERITAILVGMKKGMFERDEALALSLLSAFAGESIFLLGLPGIGKSMIARRLKLAFEKPLSLNTLCRDSLLPMRFSVPSA